MYSVRFLMDELKRLYLVQKLSNSELLQLVEKIYPHHIGHYLGMDTHDTPEISRDRPLEKRMVFTIEPGIYIPKDLDCFPPEYRGIGIRIEDDVIIENNGCLTVLSKNAPKEIDEIEHIMVS
jgi:Xaa-Pro aminopeptidase